MKRHNPRQLLNIEVIAECPRCMHVWNVTCNNLYECPYCFTVFNVGPPHGTLQARIIRTDDITQEVRDNMITDAKINQKRS